MREVRFRARSNKKACPKLSFSHVVWKNSIRYTGEKVILLKSLINIPWPKVPLPFPAPKRECGFFGPSMIKNRICNMGIKRATPSTCLPFKRALDWLTLYLSCSATYNTSTYLLCVPRLFGFKNYLINRLLLSHVYVTHSETSTSRPPATCVEKSFK